MAKILPDIISLEQAGFIKGRSILENIAMAHELVRDLNKRVRGNNLVLKLDLSKAYDRVKWSFLHEAMRAFGFSERFIDIIYRLINNSWYSIKIQNQIFGFFRGGCGLRQGDPLSPALFILVMDVFSRNLKIKMEQGSIQKFQCSRRVSSVSHLLFADDILIFSNGTARSVKNLRKLLQDFCKASGQEISHEKSKFFVSNKVSSVQCRKILQNLSFQKGTLPTKYLGVPLFCGRTKSIHFDFILDNIRRKISGWKSKLLSWGGKISIITSILNSIPIYALSVLPVPKKTVLNIQRCIADFLWNQGDQKRLHWVAWDKVAKPIEEGGLNLKLLTEASYFWRSKLAWSFLQNKSLWSSFMNKKYKQGSVSVLDSKTWKDLCPLISELNADSFWRVGRGNKIFFWSQKWWPMDLHINMQENLPDISIADVWNDSRKKDAYLAAVPEELQNFARSVHLSDSEDNLVWKGSESGVFSSKDFKNQHSASLVERNAWWKKFWQPWIPTKISCFLWKCLNNAVPVDSAVQRAKVPLVSKCVCCEKGNQETLDHLLLEGEAARSVWSFLQGIFDVYGQGFSFFQSAVRWIKNSSTDSQYGSLKILSFAVAVWELWKWRNRMIYDQPEHHHIIKHRIVSQIQNLNSLIAPKRKASWLEEIALSCLHIPSLKVKEKRGKWVKWIPNAVNLTVNIHALLKDNHFQGSFVARNNKGDVLWCTARKFADFQDLFQVNSEILRLAIITIRNSGHQVAEIQSDNGKLLECLRGKRPPPWRWDTQINDLRVLCANIELKLIEVERNLAAVLAAGAEQENIQNPQDIAKVRRVLAEDSCGLHRWSWC